MDLTPYSHPIGVFDSGIGGLSVANAILQLLPQEQLIYCGDTAHLPYGNKTPEIIRELSCRITDFLLKKGCKLIVVACNTASAAAIEVLRDQWPEISFVGMEPAVKPGAITSRNGKVGVMATQGTLGSRRYANLTHLYAQNAQIFEDPCLGLVELIESCGDQKNDLQVRLGQIIRPMLKKGIDTLVLGCTHYSLVKEEISKIAGPSVNVIDPAPAVARQVKRLLTERRILNGANQRKHIFFVTGDYPSFQVNCTTYFNSPFELNSLCL